MLLDCSSDRFDEIRDDMGAESDCLSDLVRARGVVEFCDLLRVMANSE